MIEKKMEVQAIENGTVIDHIPTDCLFKIVKIMDLEQETNRLTLGMNLDSKRMGLKAIIKINDRYCKQEEINRIAIIAPQTKVNIIKNFKVVEKLRVTVPKSIVGFVKCVNPQCITNNQPIKTHFDVMDGSGQISLRCRYCEKTTCQSQIELL